MTSKDGDGSLSVSLDAPSFGAAVNVALVVIGQAHALVWPRSTGPKED